ncbi:hypothetical protein N7492_009652 [Penicillium capsulatum]|uniref:Zn(2)-C6 fungal-type domain-containing protein n=1 Tax=Penicillium capsulatum TaxID=69766 RepID=A0A9W9HUX2_9EURO|nr:hypothetical protein N7492_009652 [Penicillium capsulatum]KAJ6107038.1 hypothetical protein N7512_010555 [Penicillium capsulatum]
MENVTTESHACPICFKTYPRRDLLLRHRRRCRGLTPRTRRKACNACVQAKAKCSYTRPCGRCTQRAFLCEYAQPIDQSQTWADPLTTPLLTDGIDASLDTGAAMQGASQGAIDPLFNFPVITLNPVNRSSLRDLALILQQYPKLLLRDDFHSPLLHHSLYDDNVPDMATLARTSMAICCGSTMESADGARFARHAMDVERQRLIQSFPTSTCMRQWDALHAMLIYGALEVRSALDPPRDEWKQKAHSRGLKDPFLAKMTRSFIQSHLDLPGSDLMRTSPPVQSWEQWSVAETARRTVFLANLLHFLSSHDLESGQCSPYYEPLQHELISKMPLPCNHALWTARTEQEWRLAVDASQSNASFIQDLPLTLQLATGCFTLQDLLSNVSQDDLQTIAAHGIGFGSSDELRGLIILCAARQFT